MAPDYRSIFRDGLFAGQAGIVTGAGSGIGRCTAHELAALGAKVALVGRRIEKLESVAREIADAGGEARCYVADIREEERVADVVRAALGDFGRIDFVVNNAGGQFASPLENISARGWDAVVRNNLTGGFLVAREAYTQWMKANGGAIVNMLADMWQGMPMMGHSGAARAGMLNFTETAAFEWAPVRVNAVAPGWVASSGLDTYEGAVRSLIPRLREAVPLKRLATEAECSGAIVFLLCEASAFTTGITIAVDGGAPLYSTLWPTPDHDRSVPFDGFHRSVKPKVLG
jgi:citronellol/citronellal dehydrogenase